MLVTYLNKYINMDFKIPSKISIGGIDLDVKIVQNIPNTSLLGECCLSEGYIKIAETADGYNQSKSSKEVTFFHELIHCILDVMNESELSSNEKFVSTFSALLAGAIKSAK